MSIEVTIKALGAGGDGIAHHNGAKLFVPGALPGERVRITPSPRRGHAKLLEQLSEAPSREVPPCNHFGSCGGCVAQHMASATYSEWKCATIRQALAHHGFHDVSIEPAITSPPASRRRVRLAVEQPSSKFGATPEIGFRCRSSHRVVAIRHCSIMLPKLEALLVPLARLVARIDAEFNELSLTAAPEGQDVILHGLGTAPNLAMREALAEFAHSEKIERISVEYHETAKGSERRLRRRGRQKHNAASVLETIVQLSAVRTHYGVVTVDLPLGAFLQPTAAGEAAIRRLVLDGLALHGVPSDDSKLGGTNNKTGKRVADCYAGLGGIGFAIAAHGGAMPPRHQVVMYEGNPKMAEAAQKAADAAVRNVAAKMRDLVRCPLTPTELNCFDAVVFDPPRAGAQTLAASLAASTVKRVVAVSCNPATFARDARILANAGFRLMRLTPVDQFLWSRHIELVAVFQRFS